MGKMKIEVKAQIYEMKKEEPIILKYNNAFYKIEEKKKPEPKKMEKKIREYKRKAHRGKKVHKVKLYRQNNYIEDDLWQEFKIKICDGENHTNSEVNDIVRKYRPNRAKSTISAIALSLKKYATDNHYIPKYGPRSRIILFSPEVVNMNYKKIRPKPMFSKRLG